MQGNDGSGQRVGRIYMVNISRIRGTKKEEGGVGRLGIDLSRLAQNTCNPKIPLTCRWLFNTV
jgi:hypothetical protein